MKQQKMTGYQPKYPKKFLRGAVLTTAAVMALGASTGCKALNGELTTSGAVDIDEPEPTELQLEGYVAPDETPDPNEVLVLDGEVAIDEPTDELELDGYVAPEDMPNPDEELTLSGDVAIAPEEP